MPLTLNNMEIVLRNMNSRLPKLILLVGLLLVIPLRFTVLGSPDSAIDSLADPSKYSEDWRSNGPPGGDVRSLVVDPTNPDRFYLGTLDGQIYA